MYTSFNNLNLSPGSPHKLTSFEDRFKDALVSCTNNFITHHGRIRFVTNGTVADLLSSLLFDVFQSTLR